MHCWPRLCGTLTQPCCWRFWRLRLSRTESHGGRYSRSSALSEQICTLCCCLRASTRVTFRALPSLASSSLQLLCLREHLQVHRQWREVSPAVLGWSCPLRISVRMTSGWLCGSEAFAATCSTGVLCGSSGSRSECSVSSRKTAGAGPCLGACRPRGRPGLVGSSREGPVGPSGDR